MMKNNTVSVGIFFDGTGNNGTNATADRRPAVNNESYYSEITNIYKLFSLFNSDNKIYIEGIGTVSGAEDSNFAMATCKNPYGYTGYSSDDKLRKAFDFMEQLNDKNKEYHLFVYGFSRGAMLARTFCYQLLTSGSEILANIRIRFLGIFDTVESTPFNDYDVDILSQVETTLHLCAVNECRYFFPLTGIFEDSKKRKDTQSYTGNSVRKEVFVPGAHADVGGGYLEGSQSVYVSSNMMRIGDIDAYISQVKDTERDSEENKIWDALLKNYKIHTGLALSQAYVVKEMVYNDLSKVYGRLMLAETNALSPVFSTGFTEQNFEIDAEKHPFLMSFSGKLEQYVKDMSPALKPVYDYEKFADYTHISANFGLYRNQDLQRSQVGPDAEQINNGLNVPSHTTVDNIYPERQSDLHLPQNGAVSDYAYGSNIPNNDSWSRSVVIKNKVLI